MPLQVKETETHPSFLPDTSSDSLGKLDSLAGRRLGENYLKLIEGRIAYPLKMRVPRLTASERPFFETETIFPSDRIRIFQGFTGSMSARKSVSSEAYNESDSTSSLIVLFAELREIAFAECKPTDEAREEEDMSDTIFSAELAGILGDLREVAGEAREEGFPIPSETAMTSSERLIREIYGISPGSYGVYPTPDGEVAIDIFNGKGSSVILLCDSEGGVLCMVNIEGNRRRAHYSQRDTLPDGFIREALTELKL